MNGKLYHYQEGLILTEQPTCILQVGDRVMVKDLEEGCTYEITETWTYTVKIVNVDTNVSLIIHIRDIEMVYY